MLNDLKRDNPEKMKTTFEGINFQKQNAKRVESTIPKKTILTPSSLIKKLNQTKSIKPDFLVTQKFKKLDIYKHPFNKNTIDLSSI
jgi:hypothetical protein